MFPRNSLGRAALVLWGSLLLMAVGCGDEEEPAEVTRPIRAINISDEPTFSSRTFPGTVEAVDAVELSFRVSGPLVTFPGNLVGKTVKKGDLLAQIDARDFEVRVRDAQASLLKARSELEAMRKARPEEIEQMKAEVDRAEAAALFAQSEYKRNLQLIETSAVSKSDLEMSEAKAKLADAEVVQAQEALRIGMEGARPEDINSKEAQIDSLQAGLQTAQDQLNDTQLVAPYDGTIAATYVENYEVVQAKEPILRLVNTSDLEFRVDIPENLIALVPKVTEAFVTVQSLPDLNIPARVAEVGTEASSITRTYPVKLRFSRPEGVDIRPGMTGIAFGRGTQQASDDAKGHVIPASAVMASGEQRRVWIYDEAKKSVRSRVVQVTGTTPFGLNVTGLKPGEWVVTAGVHYLNENQAVRLLTNAQEVATKT